MQNFELFAKLPSGKPRRWSRTNPFPVLETPATQINARGNTAENLPAGSSAGVTAAQRGRRSSKTNATKDQGDRQQACCTEEVVVH